MSSINGKSKKASESDKSVRGGASDYIKRRWSVVPIPYKAKAPEIKGWQDLRISENEVDSYFKAKRQNVGVLLGEPSGWLVDVDLDCDEAVRLAPHILPPTAAVFGRAGNRSSHRLYVSPDLKTTKFQAKDDGMLLELRSTRLQTLFPPSVHPGGETIIWVKQGAPAEVDAGDLLEACEILAAAALLVRHWPDQGSRHGVALALAGAMLPAGWSVKDVKLLMEIVTTEAGDEEVDDRVRAVADTHHRLKRGQRVTGMPRLAELMGDDVVKSLAKWLGLDASVDRLVLSPAAPLESAQQFVSHAYSTGGARTIHHHQGGFYAWSGTYYPEVGLDEIRARLYSFLGEAVTLATGSDGGYAPFNPNAGKVSQVIDALKSVAHLAPDQAAPCWLDDRSKPDPYNLLACGNGLLQSRPRKLLPHTPDFFNHHALPFDFNPRAPEPVEWLNFLNSLWPKDAEAINTLQEIMGYLLTNDTRQQKIFMLVGPARSGKGTIGRVLGGLLGKANVAAPTLASLATNFGLQPLINKQAAIISDARMGGRTDHQVIAERLLSISGEDAITIDRKYRETWTGQLPVRFVVLTNEIPRISDASGALSSRFIVLRLTKSFLEKEDHGLSLRLFRELPGILNWALDGLDRLLKRGFFLAPRSGWDDVRQLQDLASPVAAFVRDKCVLDHKTRIPVHRLYLAYKEWCESEGGQPSSKQTFGRDLKAAFPNVKLREGSKGAGRRFYSGMALVDPDH